MKRPKFSIIIPVYNVEDYLSICLNSIVNQSLRDIEIICVNDGSKDKSSEILKLYENKDDRIIVVEKENGGLSSARNKGLKCAKGEYILFLDSDDYVQNNLCERLYKEVLERKPDIIVFGANVFPIYPAPDPWYNHNLSPGNKTYKGKSVEALINENGAYPFVWRNCYKKDFLDKHNAEFNEVVKYAEDTVFQFCVFPFAYNISFISDKLYNYRWYRDGSLMNNLSRDLGKKYKWHIDAISTILEYWNQNSLLSQYSKELFEWSVYFMGWDLRFYKGPEKKELINRLFELWKKYGLLKYKSKLKFRQKLNFQYLYRYINR